MQHCIILHPSATPGPPCLMPKFSILLFLLSITAAALGQDAGFFKPNHLRRELKAVKIVTNLKIDGELKEPEWELTRGASDFIQIEPQQGNPSQFVTIIKVLYNQKFLYVGVICKDPKRKKAIMAVDFARDFDILRHDLVDLAFDTFNDQRNAVVFANNDS